MFVSWRTSQDSKDKHPADDGFEFVVLSRRDPVATENKSYNLFPNSIEKPLKQQTRSDNIRNSLEIKNKGRCVALDLLSLHWFFGEFVDPLTLHCSRAALENRIAQVRTNKRWTGRRRLGGPAENSTWQLAHAAPVNVAMKNGTPWRSADNMKLLKSRRGLNGLVLETCMS